MEDQTSTAGLAIGGYSPQQQTKFVEQWDGSSWTEVGDIKYSKRMDGAGSGTYTECIIFGGDGLQSTT